MRFLASEIIREKLFLALEQELPYNVAVEIESWEENPDRTVIHAAIYTSKNSHKKMIVGRQGQNLKRVGQAAREELRSLLGVKMHLEPRRSRPPAADTPEWWHPICRPSPRLPSHPCRVHPSPAYRTTHIEDRKSVV